MPNPSPLAYMRRSRVISKVDLEGFPKSRLEHSERGVENSRFRALLDAIQRADCHSEPIGRWLGIVTWDPKNLGEVPNIIMETLTKLIS